MKLTIPELSFVVLIGVSGSGKSGGLNVLWATWPPAPT